MTRRIHERVRTSRAWYLAATMIRAAVMLAVCLGAFAHAAAPSVATSAPAPSDDVAKEARASFLAGQKAYKQNKYREAIERFEKAYALKPHPIIRFNLAKCFEQLDDPVQALRNYRTYLFEVPDTIDREQVTKSITALERKMTRKNLQQLMVLAEPRDASITVDDKLLSLTPAFIELGPGDHRVVIARDGLETVSRSFVMSTQKSMELSIVLQPPAPVTATTSTKSADASLPAPPPTPPPLLVTTGTNTNAAASAGLRSRIWAPLIGLGAGAIAAGVGFGLTYSLKAQLTTELSTAHQVTPRAENLAAQGQAFQTLAWVGSGVAVAGLITTVVFLLVPAEAPVQPTANLTPQGASFGLTGLLP